MYGATRPARAQSVTNDLPGRRTAAHRRPPSFCLLLLLALTGHAAPGGAYRLAGVMSVGEDRIGFLEVPGGGQVLVRRGSTVDGGRVTVFDQRELRIVFTDRTVVLELSDNGEAGSISVPGVVRQHEDTKDVMVREIDPEQLMASLSHVAKAAPVTPAGRKPDPRAELGRRFALVANLPSTSRVVAINEQPVTTAERAMSEIERSLADGLPVRLNLATPSGGPPGRVYLLPATQP
jgi:hypothetical protein